MATIDAVVRTILLAETGVTDIVSTRIYPIIMPHDPTFPLLVYRQISGNEILRSAPKDGVEMSTRFQFDIWGRTYADTQPLRQEIVDLFTGYQGVVSGKRILSSGVDLTFSLYEDDTMLYRHSITVAIQHEGA